MADDSQVVKTAGGRFGAVERWLNDPETMAAAPLFILSILAVLISFVGAFFQGEGLMYVAGFLVLLAVVSVFFIIMYLKNSKEKNYSAVLIPLLLLYGAYHFWVAHGFTASQAVYLRDFIFISLMPAIFLLFYSLHLLRLVKLRVALIFAIFLCTLIFHIAPAGDIAGDESAGKFLSALDPYYFYRHANYVYENGFVPEKENLVYPTNPPDFSVSRFMASLFMGSMTTVLSGFGITTMDVAMVYPAVFAAFMVFLIYLLMRDLFSDMQPYNYAVGLLAAFMLMLNPSFAAKAIATNCEDDTFGMFLLIASFLLSVLAYRRRSYLIMLLAGFSFLMLNLSWNGYTYAVAVVGVFALVYAIARALHKENAFTHIPYFLVPILISRLSPIILHARGGIPIFPIPSKLELIALGVPLFAAIFLEFIRRMWLGGQGGEAKTIEEKTDLFVQKNIFAIAGVAAFFSLVFFATVFDPVSIWNFIVENIQGAKVQEIIGMTTAEQASLCKKFDVGNPFTYFSCFYDRDSGYTSLLEVFFFPILSGVLMIPILIYYAFFKRSLGAVFVLSWSLPMIWGVIHKSQYQFTASVPIVALGATLGLILTLDRKDFTEGLRMLRVIPMILAVSLPIFLFLMVDPYNPMTGGVFLLQPFGGRIVMNSGGGSDIILWDGTLQWLKQQPDDTVVLTWWDYGHWIAAVSGKTSIADNTKADRFIVQDLAKFHVLVENESEGLKIAEKYNATHVIIDYTMISKSGAPHFIATSNLTAPYSDLTRTGEYTSYGLCRYYPSESMSRLESDGKGGSVYRTTLVFGCTLPDIKYYKEYVGRIDFEFVGDSEFQVMVYPFVLTSGGGVAISNRPVSWETWRQQQKASVLGLQNPQELFFRAMAYHQNPAYYVNFPTYTSLVYVPEKFNRYMMTSLYLGDYMEEYRQLGLVDSSVRKLEHFKLVDGFRGSLAEFSQGADLSYLGYVRVYEIDYPEE